MRRRLFSTRWAARLALTACRRGDELFNHANPGLPSAGQCGC